jgi:MSHA biogenesis protein MshJ
MIAWQAQFERGTAALTRLRRRFDARARRERVLMIAAAVAVAYLLADRVWLTPAFAEWKAVHARQGAAAAAMQRLNDEIAQRAAQTRAEIAQTETELVVWREKVAQGDARLRAFGTSLVPAADILPLLDRMLAQVGGLRLRSMQSLPRTELTATRPDGTPASAGAGPALYRHGVELAVEGSFADLLAYMQALEDMPQRVLWGGVQLKVEQYPKALLTLRIYTLSLDRGWLEL